MRIPLAALLLAGCATPSPAPAIPAPGPAPPAPAVALPAPAPEAAPTAPPLEPAPDLDEARAERLRAKEAADAGDGTTAQLHLLDARAAVDRFLARFPADREALREAGRIERDSLRFGPAAERFRAALEGTPDRDGETVYDLAYCLAYGGDFAAALPLFLEAGRLIGPEPRVEVNTAICEERTGDRAAGVVRLARLYAAELAAGRDGRVALEKTWDLTVQKRDYEGGVAALEALAKAHPDRPGPPFMLGNLYAFLNRHGPAADAYGRASALGPMPAALARRAKALAASGAGARAAADRAVRAALEGAADQPETAPAAVGVVRLLLAAGEIGPARDLAVAAAGAIEGDRDLRIAEGDAHLAEGRTDLADRAYARAREIDPFSAEAGARAGRASLAAVRAGHAAVESLVDVPAPPLDPVPPREPLLDFEDSALFVHPLGAARFSGGAARFAAPAPGGTRRIFLHLFPDLDGRRWTRLEVRVRTEAPGTLEVRLADGYDQMADEPPGYLRAPEAFSTGPEWTVVSVPFRAFVPDPAGRTTGPDLPRVKCAILEFTAAPWIDSVAVRDEASGAVRVLQSFDRPPEETAFAFEGTTTPFTRVVAMQETVADLVPTGSGPISPTILADQNGTFEPALVGRGTGAVRIRHGETSVFPSREALSRAPARLADGPGAGVVRLNPDRDVQRFRALTFLARGEKGGERLRVRLADVGCLALEPILPPARWPRSMFPRTVREDGAIVLGREWRMFRIPFEAFPEVDRSALAEVRFEVGSEAGNAPGATIYLDEIGLEY